MDNNSNMISDSIQRLTGLHNQYNFIKLSSLKFVRNISSILNKQKRRKSKVYPLSFKTTSGNSFMNVLRQGIIEGITYQSVIDFLKVPKYDRKLTMIKTIGEFFATHYTFFKQLYNTNIEKVYAIVNVLTIEKFNQHDAVIRYGEEGTKFYIILKGSVGIYKPKLVPKNMTLKNFVKMLLNIKSIERDEAKLKRVENANSAMYNIEQIRQNNYDYKKLPFDKNKLQFYEEIEEKIAEEGEGSSFGEVALLQKTARNATIRSLEDNCYIASITKKEYNKIIKQIETKAFYDKIEEFKQDFDVLKNWTKQSIIKLFNILSKRNLIKGEYLYHQGEPSNYIYFIKSGSFDIYADVTLGSLNSFLKYINSSKLSIIPSIRTKTEILAAGGIEAYLKLKLKNEKKYPIDLYSTPNEDMYSSEGNEDDLIELKIKEMIVKNPNKLYRIKIRSSFPKEIFGLEEAFELKRHFCSVVCTSTAHVKAIKLSDFVSLLINRYTQIDDVEKMINEKKGVWLERINCCYLKKESTISRQLKFEYDKLYSKHNYALSDNESNNATHLVTTHNEVKKSFAIPTHRVSKSFCISKKGKNIIISNNIKKNPLRKKVLSEDKQREINSASSTKSVNELPFKMKSVHCHKNNAKMELNDFESELFKIPGLFTTKRYNRPQSNYSLNKEDISLLSVNANLIQKNDSKWNCGCSFSSYLLTTTNSKTRPLSNHTRSSNSFHIHKDQIPISVKMKYYSVKPKIQLVRKKKMK